MPAPDKPLHERCLYQANDAPYNKSWASHTAALLREAAEALRNAESLLVACYPVIDGCGAGWLRARFPAELVALSTAKAES